MSLLSAAGRTIIVRELLIALAILIGFLFLGRFILELLHVSPAALTAGGGFILLLIARRMIFPTGERLLREEVREEPFVVPLAILSFASGLRQLLGRRGLTAIERLMGMLLVIVAVEMLMAGAAEYLRR